jgi:hypothetical protein
LQRDDILQGVGILHEIADQLILRLKIDVIPGHRFGYQTGQLQLAGGVKIRFFRSEMVARINFFL